MPGKGIQESLQTLKPFVEALFRSDEAVADHEVHDVRVDVRWLGSIFDGGKLLPDQKIDGIVSGDLHMKSRLLDRKADVEKVFFVKPEIVFRFFCFFHRI